MVVCGNPPEYILLFGGVTEETLDMSTSSVTKIRRTLNDLWVYYVGSRLWQRLYVNSPIKPEKRELGIMMTVRTDRLVLMYGGLQGQTIYDDVWQYNINSNIWYQVDIPERRLPDREFNLRNCTACVQCVYCGDFRTVREECTKCYDCFAEPLADGSMPSVYPCSKCEHCENEDYDDCYECTDCTGCDLLMDVMKPPKLKGHSVVVASQGIIMYGGITWPDVDMSVSDLDRRRYKDYEELCKKTIERLVTKEQIFVP